MTRKYTKPPRDGCAGYTTWTDCGEEFDCEYAPNFDCDECMYCGHNGSRGLNPQAKCNQQPDTE